MWGLQFIPTHLVIHSLVAILFKLNFNNQRINYGIEEIIKFLESSFEESQSWSTNWTWFLGIHSFRNHIDNNARHLLLPLSYLLLLQCLVQVFNPFKENNLAHPNFTWKKNQKRVIVSRIHRSYKRKEATNSNKGNNLFRKGNFFVLCW